MKRTITLRAFVLLGLMLSLTLISTRLRADTGNCGGNSITLPFDDVGGNIFFCAIAQAFFTGLTNGTSPTTYSPQDLVTREQMAAFITRTQDSAIRRGSRRVAVGQWWTPKNAGVLNTTPMADTAGFNCFDGEDIWVANGTGSVTRVHASDGRVLGTWTGADGAKNTIAAAGFIYITGRTGQPDPGRIYRIDPTQPPGAVTVVEDNLGPNPRSITFDGLNLWTANAGAAAGTGSITRYNVVTDTATTFGVGFNQPQGIIFDGTHLWVVDQGDDALYRVNPADGAILETLSIGAVGPSHTIPAFDGANLWVPLSNRLVVVSTSTPARLLATLTGNGLGDGEAAAFDGERIMVTNSSGDRVSLWKATSLTPLGNLSVGTGRSPIGVCSDGLHFWITVSTSAAPDLLLRF